MATEDARYRQSTQFRLWSFSTAKLADLREKTNALAISQISARMGSLQQDRDGGGEPLPEFLTPAEEVQLMRFYITELMRAADFCELPTEIRATAAVFLRRFYVTNSVMTYPPMDLLKTCLFFGSKAEGFYTRLNKFAEKFPNTSPEKVVAGEFLLSQGIRFAFDVRHPFRALEGAILELQRRDKFEASRIKGAHAYARAVLKFSSLITDAYFHYTPSQIMLAALSMADRELADELINEAFALNRTANGHADVGKKESISSGMKDKVIRNIESCRDMLAEEPPERMKNYWEKEECQAAIKPLMRKLKKCRDPDRTDLVALQKARREMASQKQARKAPVDDDAAVFGDAGGGEVRDAKRRKVTKADDIFGPAL